MGKAPEFWKAGLCSHGKAIPPNDMKFCKDVVLSGELTTFSNEGTHPR
jgi:hypothetical protein